MRVVIAGSSGLIGTALVSHLRETGHDVLRLVRRTPAAPDERGWDPPAGHVDDGTFDGVDAVINLGGVGIADRPWTGARRQEIRDSRIVPTEVLAAAVARYGVPAFLSGSATGFYGDTGGVAVDETAPHGRGFLAEVCADWEAATAAARDAGARVVPLRTGLVLSPAGGLLGLLRPLFKAFLGGRLGPGTQYMPWVSLDDEVGGIRFALETPSITGPVNLVGPTPATNAEVTKALAAAVGRPTSIPVPAVVIKTVLGSMGEEMLLFGQRVVPAALESSGYQFRHHAVGEALSAAVGS
ncbi:TIGR01777 family protein [Pseudonocardia sp. KRD-184]|uniref:TIGR01777 family protein n=1 Tax=Pseudonocardia oceani TaxID=2792013 RepID=A0ABS6U3N2_9PSEU|nr:TIGR01777 family oxidoreductase [Pseudonocardia oceani]MBW0091235.1 TIGR01777 family protein [Pseudonocardia oceani]MBW0097525.1 TIGR01777 family protein [Pseudonocardia oceani]MBW0110720.1 TIGR01777 family protein [Pseudonocardia oceani]MBW0124786.1 TIGR01777 family protein [Pseudonocardia oceani]MBW0126847.1 TIGR01777 family protein [Pseudonocardia oceani]